MERDGAKRGVRRLLCRPAPGLGACLVILVAAAAAVLSTGALGTGAASAALLPGLPLPIIGSPPPSTPSSPPAPARLPPPPPRPSRPPAPPCSGTSARGRIAYMKPVFPCDFSDPMVLKVGRSWFAYSTSEGWERPNRSFTILRSSDLRHWRFVGDALDSQPPGTNGDLWSPSVVLWRHRYLLYFNERRSRGNVHCLAVATATRPEGPFQARGPLACRDGGLQGFIDPAPLVAPGGRLYLFFSVDSSRHPICALSLSGNGLRAVGHARRVLNISSRWRNLRSRTQEAPFPLHRGGRYYLFYSTGAWAIDYRMSYAVARSPLGPYHDRAPATVLRGRRGLRSPGGGSVVQGLGGTTWLAFQAWTGRPGYQYRGSQRTMRIAPLRWTRSGPRLVLTGGA